MAINIYIILLVLFYFVLLLCIITLYYLLCIIYFVLFTLYYLLCIIYFVLFTLYYLLCIILLYLYGTQRRRCGCRRTVGFSIYIFNGNPIPICWKKITQYLISHSRSKPLIWITYHLILIFI